MQNGIMYIKRTFFYGEVDQRVAELCSCTASQNPTQVCGNVKSPSPGHSISRSSEKTVPRRHKRKSGYIQVCNKESTQLERQRLLLNKENQISSFCFPDSSADKESACNAGDPGSIPGSGRSPGEGIGYPLQYSWASLMAQLGKNLPAMWETWVQFLGWEDILEKRIAAHSSILAWRIPWTV